MGAATSVRRATRPSKPVIPATPQLDAIFEGRDCRLLLSAGGRDLLAGPVEAEVLIDGRRLSATADWEHVCTLDEPLACYIEFSQTLAEGWILERQLLLSRADRFLYIADCLLGPAAAEVGYRLRWPLADGRTLMPSEQTHEARLTLDRGRSLLALPLSCPEWRAEERERCSLKSENETLVLSQQLRTQRLHAALFFDLDPARSKRPFTWRRLAVGEERRPVPREMAAGYRVQVGKQQWIFYRSLGEVGNRTVLGVNLCTDFLAARMSASGEVTPLIEIE